MRASGLDDNPGLGVGVGDLYIHVLWVMGATAFSHFIAANDIVEYMGRKHPSAFSHIALIFEWQHGPALIGESLVKRGIRLKPYEALKAARARGEVVRYYHDRLDLDQEAAMKIWWAFCETFGKPYDHIHLLFLLWYIRAKGRTMEEIPAILRYAENNRYICIEAVLEWLDVVEGLVEEYLGKIATRVTSTPESAFYARYGLPSMAALGRFHQ